MRPVLLESINDLSRVVVLPSLPDNSPEPMRIGPRWKWISIASIENCMLFDTIEDQVADVTEIAISSVIPPTLSPLQSSIHDQELDFGQVVSYTFLFKYLMSASHLSSKEECIGLEIEGDPSQ
jgi:hypothetical protein